jgi:hypothetical protein
MVQQIYHQPIIQAKCHPMDIKMTFNMDEIRHSHIMDQVLRPSEEKFDN